MLYISFIKYTLSDFLYLSNEQFMVTSCNNELYKHGPVTVRELLKARENINGS